MLCSLEVAQALQSPKLSLAKAYSMVKALSSMWNSDRCDSRFAVFWDTVVRKADNLGVEPPCSNASRAMTFTKDR